MSRKSPTMDFNEQIDVIFHALILAQKLLVEGRSKGLAIGISRLLAANIVRRHGEKAAEIVIKNTWRVNPWSRRNPPLRRKRGKLIHEARHQAVRTSGAPKAVQTKTMRKRLLFWRILRQRGGCRRMKMRNSTKQHQRKWAKYRKYLRLIGAIALGVFETAVAVMFTFYIELREDWHRVALAAETFIIVSAIFVGIEAWHRKKLPSVRRGLKLGAILFIYNAVIVPFASYFVGAFSKGAMNDDPALMASGLSCLIVGGVIALACIHHYRRTLTEPESELRFAWPTRGAQHRQQSEQAHTEPGDVDSKPRREWRIPSIASLVIWDHRRISLVMMGRCAAALVLIYLLGVRFGVIREDVSAPVGDMGPYYGVIGAMIACGVGVLYFGHRAKGRFDGRLLRRAAAQVLIAFAVVVLGQQVIDRASGLPTYANAVVQYSAITLFVAGSVKFLRLPWSFWR